MSFPKAKHLLCDIHMKDSIEMKLNQLKISDNNKFKITSLIFGTRLGMFFILLFNLNSKIIYLQGEKKLKR
jgi:hypothetical protein